MSLPAGVEVWSEGVCKSEMLQKVWSCTAIVGRQRVEMKHIHTFTSTLSAPKEAPYLAALPHTFECMRLLAIPTATAAAI